MVPIKLFDTPIVFNQNGFELMQAQIIQNKYSKIFILVDTNTSIHCLPILLGDLATDVIIEIIEIESGEASKTIETCISIWQSMAALGGDRKSLLINLGGGVVTDIGGFIATTYKRGIDFMHIPTTLLGMVDAAIGGKNGVDLDGLKNQIGTINHPLMIIVHPDFLQTLSSRDMRSGLAEMMKHGLIADIKHWRKFSKLNALTTDDLDQLIYESMLIKADIVKEDPFEKNKRKVLNFGHTLGHALESFFLENKSKNDILHGEAIAAGMIMESHLSFLNGTLSLSEFLDIKKTFHDVFEKLDYDENDIDNIISYLTHDKKNEYGKILFSLLDKPGKGNWNQACEITKIHQVLQDYITS